MSDELDATLHFPIAILPNKILCYTGSEEQTYVPEDVVTRIQDENAKLQWSLPMDCDGNVLDIADTVHMLRSEYDGDREWDDVVVELVLTKWGGDRWIVRGSRGEAWACDCAKTGYDEDAYECSGDADPIDNPTLIEAENERLKSENSKLRELVQQMRKTLSYAEGEADTCEHCGLFGECASRGWHECEFDRRMSELGAVVEHGDEG